MWNLVVGVFCFVAILTSNTQRLRDSFFGAPAKGNFHVVDSIVNYWQFD
ncbi:MAG: hypothetical protein BWY38_03043 [Ignavibacteria bacterium ADurb.Bin266]|nr:MAG: hypothetical protein BWY38_03043 [Ignavibacteria bacterium ADurb.Bin266]